ncbi:MAG TPA: lysylphosphatidylglycerol synthase domain-containing protein [Candidatus Cloacimonadota bacterium]|nr:lysylphosphatidylglycerol synthase domain-containing protein [Candidatus Cloacimonadota bacterium]
MKKKIVFTVQLLFTVLLFYLIVQRWSISLPRLSSLLVKPGWLLLSFLISAFVIPLLAARRWQVILHFNGFYPSLTELLKINFSSIFWGTFLPSSDGFAAIRMYKIEKKYPLNHGVAGSTIVTEKLLGMFCLCLLGFLFSLSLRQIPNIAGIRRAISLLILIILIVCLLIFNQKLAAGFARLKPRTRLMRSIFSFIQNMQASLQNLPLGTIMSS